MRKPAMSEPRVDVPQAGATVPPRNKGQQLVDAYRLARMAARPALRAELRDCRTELQQQRVGRNGHGSTPAAPRAQAAAPVLEAAPDNVSGTSLGSEAGASIFATYCVAMAAPAPADEPLHLPEPPAQPEPPAPPEPEPREPPEPPVQLAPPEPPAMAAPAIAPVVPLSAIGFGPGMVIRMSQLGIESASDLAAADATWLQTALGDLSDLVHAERWIASAREACSQSA